MIDARWVGERFAIDPAFHIPRKPRFPREYLVLSGDDGLSIEGAPERQLLRGKAVKEFLPELIALLDGTRSLDDLAAAFPTRPSGHIRDAVTLLYSRGLLEDGPLDAPDDDVSAFLGRYVDHTRHHRHRGEATGALASATAALVAPPAIASMLRVDLLSAGVGTVVLVTDETIESVSADLTVVVETQTFSAQSLLRRVSEGWILYATLGSDNATIGPLCVPGYSVCYACYVAHYRVIGAAEGKRSEAFWSGVIGTNVFNVLSRIAFPPLYNRIQRMTSHGDQTQTVREVAPRIPSCERCGCGADVFPHDPAFFAWMLHTMTAMPPRALLDRRSYQDHFKPGNITLARALPQARPGATVVDLPAGGLGAMRGTLDVEHVAALLQLAAGYDRSAAGDPRRLTPTGGNLGSPELMTVVRGVVGLADGVYRYIGAHHQLERVRAFDPTIARLIAGSDGGLPRVIVVGTGLLDRVFTKYHVFAYRVVNVDAGFCVASLMLGAAALGLRIIDHANFDPGYVAELLQLPARTKLRYPTFVLSVVADADGGPANAGVEAFERVLHADVDVRRPTPSIGPALDAIVRRFPTLLRARRAIRDFAPSAVERATLEQILRVAADVAAHYRHNRGRTLPLQAWVAIGHDGPDLPAGLYRFERTLEWCAPLPGGAMAALFQQENMSSAAVGVFIATDLERAFAARGASGYREALVAAGVLAAGIVHAATAAGIASCPSGGFFEHGLRETRPSDGFRDCPLFAVALGHARYPRVG